MDKNKLCDITVDLAKSVVITGVKTLAEKSFTCSWIKNWYEEYGNVSGERRANIVETEFNRKFLRLEDELGKEKILNTPNLASLFTSTYQSAMTDVSEDKVAFYANTLVNAIKNENIDNTKTHIFLNMLRDFTLLHIEILKSLSVKKNISYSLAVNETYENWKKCINEIHPRLLNDEELFDIVYSDLSSKKMVKNTFIVYSCGNLDKQTTQLADEFLAFISEQEKNND